MTTVKKKERRNPFAPQTKAPQEDIWYSAIPTDLTWGIYARQSTPAQVINNIESTEMQTEDLIQFLVNKGVKEGNWKLFDADLGLSGTLTIDERTGLQDLVEHIKEDKVKAVLVYQISRLFRDDTGVEYNTFAKICKENDCVLMTADGMLFNFNNRMHLKMFRFLAEYAAEFIPQQLGLLHAARLRKARRGLFVGFGHAPRGYIVDYDRESPNYQRLIPYAPFCEPIINLFERFYSLEGNLNALCREVAEMPYFFPSYDSEMDKRNIRDQRWRKVPGGYHITRRGIIRILTNPVYIGWHIVGGDIVSTNNHERIIPPEKEYLFWFAFDCLSEYTTEGKKNTKRTLPPRRFYRRHTNDEVGLLKERIFTPNGKPVYVHFCDAKRHHSYRIYKDVERLGVKLESEVDIDLVDNAFTQLLFKHLRQVHDFDNFKQWGEEIIQKREIQKEIIFAQLEEIKIQQEAIMDERIALRTHINQQIKAALAKDDTVDIEELKTQFEAQIATDIERLRVRSQKLDEREKELLEKLPNGRDEREVHVARTFADFQTEIEKLSEVWDLKPAKEKREFINLLARRVELSIAATHWVKITVYWTHPAWPTETLYVYRRRGGIVEWTDEEKELVRQHYPNTSRNILLALLPNKSWTAIARQAHKMNVVRTPKVENLGIDNTITWLDYQFCNEHAIPLGSRDTVIESSNANDDPSLTSAISP